MDRRIARSALYGLFAVWFGLTVAGQKLYRKEGVPSRWDRLHMVIPDWRFFAPNPGVHDKHLLMRDQLADGTFSAWREISAVEERTLAHALWHPHRRAEKTIFDLTAELLRFIGKHTPAGGDSIGRADPAVQLSVPYLTLLTHVTAKEHAPGAVRTQFLIAMSGGYEEEPPAMVFLSELHPITDAVGEASG